MEASRVHLKLATLIAPADGTVTEVFVNAYEYASDGQPILEMSDPTELFVEVEMDDLEVASIDFGGVLMVTFEALSGVEVDGRVISIMPNKGGDRERNFIVLVELEAIPEGLLWGMTAEVIIPQE